MATQAKTFDFAVSLDTGWNATSDRGGPVLAREDMNVWTPEHLLLASLARCSLSSLRYHCRRAGIEAVSSASARGTVTRRESDGRFAFVEITVEADVSLSPEPDEAAVGELLGKAERDCFVGASLTAAPTYEWRVA